MTVTRIPVGGEHPYDVVVGTGILGELPPLIGPRAATVMVIAPRVPPSADVLCRRMSWNAVLVASE